MDSQLDDFDTPRDRLEDLLMDTLNAQPRPRDYADDAAYDDAAGNYLQEFADKLQALIAKEAARQQIKWIERFLLAWSGDMGFEPKDSMQFQLAELQAALTKGGDPDGDSND
jgi:hypothetical protein